MTLGGSRLAGVPCTIDGCAKEPEFARGWCRMHWNRWRRHGDPTAVMQIQGDDLARLAQYYDRRGPDECWPWTGQYNKEGYGRTTTRSRKTYAHRFMYELFVGPIPDGLTIDHTCHNADLTCPGGACTHRGCVNPAHLEAVTTGENLRRGFARKRARLQALAGLNAH